MSGIAVLCSGTGSILSALVGEGLPVEVVLVDRPCAAEEVAFRAGIALERVLRSDFSAHFKRESYTRRVVAALHRYDLALVAMAGFGTILSQEAHDAYPARIVNTHPALLPAFKGWHAVRDALEAGVRETGCTVHLASLAVDEGPILAQERVPVEPGDDEESLHERIKVVERRIYPEALKALLADEGIGPVQATKEAS